jgi:hypothetical protein
MKAWQIGFEAQNVIALRMLRIAPGGARAEAEASRMLTEKMLAAGEAQVAATTAVMKGHKEHVVAGKTLAVYGKRVRANTTVVPAIGNHGNLFDRAMSTANGANKLWMRTA